MTRTNKSGERLALGRYERLLEGDALISLQNRLTDTDQAISIAYGCRDVGNFVTARFALAESTAKLFKSFEKKRLDIVRLQFARFGTLHILAHAPHAAGIHGVVR